MDRDDDTAGGLPHALATDNETERQIRRIEESLTHVLFGDFTQVVTLESSDPLWGNLAMHINVAINAARNAIERAEESEVEASAARDRALLAASAESRFLTNVTHELRTPLASIRACAEILRDFNVDDLQAQTEFLGIIVQESDRLTRLIEDVLDIGKLEAHEVDWHVAEVDVASSVAEAVRVLSPMAMTRSVAIRVEAGTTPVTFADADRMTQVWTNLIGNAVKFSGEGQFVDVVVGGNDERITIEVVDRGPGIPEEDRKRIFQRFRQVSSDILTDKPAGSGLGLAIAREIVEQHGGRIEIVSEVGLGSTFRVLLPVVPTAAAWPDRTALDVGEAAGAPGPGESEAEAARPSTPNSGHPR